MTSLTRAKQMTRVFAIAFGVVVVLLIAGRIFISILSVLNTSQQTAKSGNTVTLTYGQIDAPKLPLAKVTSSSATLQLDLVSGNYPEATTSAKVYEAADSSLSLSAQDRARAKATNLGFTSEPSQPTPTSLRWKEGIRSLMINLNNQTFNYTADIDSISFSNRQSFSRFSPVNQLVSQFVQSQFQFTDLQYETPDVQFVNPVAGQYVPQSDTAVAPTNYARATFLRQKIDNLPIYSSSGKFGPISIVIIPGIIKERDRSTTLDIDQIVELQNNYMPIQLDKSATYPVITPQSAFAKLKASPGNYLVSVTPINSNTAPATFASGRVLFITLSYLEPDSNNSDFVQPVWMFEGRANTDVGDARWIAYVPAIDRDLVSKLLGAR